LPDNVAVGVTVGDASLLFDEDLFATNYVTNPNFEVDTAGWTGITGTYGAPTVSRDTVEHYSGTASLKLVGNAGSGIRTTFSVGTLSKYTKFSASAWFKGAVGKIYYFQFSGSGGTGFIATGNWQKITAKSNGYIGATTLTLNLYNESLVGVRTFYLDAVTVVAGSVASDFFDGSTTDTSYHRYEWSGTPNASTSLKYVKTPYYVPVDSSHMPTLLELDVDFTPYYI